MKIQVKDLIVKSKAQAMSLDTSVQNSVHMYYMQSWRVLECRAYITQTPLMSKPEVRTEFLNVCMGWIQVV